MTNAILPARTFLRPIPSFPSLYLLPLSAFPSSPTYPFIPSSRLPLLPPHSPPSHSPEVGVRPGC